MHARPSGVGVRFQGAQSAATAPTDVSSHNAHSNAGRCAAQRALSSCPGVVLRSCCASAWANALSLRYTQRDGLRDVRPTGVKCVLQPAKRKGAVSRPQRSRNACHQQRPARRAHNRLQEALHIVRGGILHHARILRVVRNEARHPGAPPAAPLMLLVDRPSYARDAPMAAVGTRRVCASAGSPCERRGGEQVHVRSARMQRQVLRVAASRECALSRRYAPLRCSLTLISVETHVTQRSQSRGSSSKTVSHMPPRPKALPQQLHGQAE